MFDQIASSTLLSPSLPLPTEEDDDDNDNYDHYNAASSDISLLPTISYETKEWGSQHPDFNLSLSQRCTWTPTEVNWVGRWCTNDLLDNPSSSQRIVSRCLKAIHATPSAWPLFHRNHVLNSGRLKFGWEKFKMQRDIASDSDDDE